MWEWKKLGSSTSPRRHLAEKIGQMRSLESLDLSNNNLSGTIPSSISALTFLTRLNLSYNNLHGPIPTGSQLQTLEDPSMIYVRNPGLCGDTLPNKCEKPNALTNMVPGGNEEEEDEDNREKVLFYVVVFLGFATGFWGVVGVLFLRKTWRYALFEFVDDMMDYLYVQVVVRIKRLRN